MAYRERVETSIDVATVWAGHPVRFALLTHGDRQFVAFYDERRRMTVGVRMLDETAWRFAHLPVTTDWDAHKSVDMAIDDDGHIHLSGTMHVDPLVYFRTTKPCEVDSFERLPGMVGRDERRCTYPQFLRGPDGGLLFTYRDGTSGGGNQIINAYDVRSRTWRRLIEGPLIDGEGERNAYLDAFHPFRLGPVGYVHLCWVWRETPDCATNHSPSYARSKDLVHWECSDGSTLALPITLRTGEVVNPVPVGGGIINGNVKMGFDTSGGPIVSYHKFDEAGKTQVYNARREEHGWHVYRTSDWDYRWEFEGGGTIPFEIRIGPVTVEPDGLLSQWYRHVRYGSGTWLLDEATLTPIAEDAERNAYPQDLVQVRSQAPGMMVNFAHDLGESGDPGARYVLRWESLEPNRDRAREGSGPPPSILRVYELRTDERCHNG